MSDWETFNPYLKRKRLQRKLEKAERELKQLRTASTETDTQLTSLRQHGFTRNILLDAPTEIIVMIMKLLEHEDDIMALYDVIPRMKTIFQQNNLAKYFFDRDYGEVEGVKDIAGFFCSGRTYESVETTILPAGKYILGILERILSSDIMELLSKKKHAYYQEGVYIVRNYNRHSGKFIVYSVMGSNTLTDNEGWNYCTKKQRSSFIRYFACVPFSLVKGSHRKGRKIIDSISPIKCTYFTSGASYGEIAYHEGTLTWTDRVHGNKTLTWKAYES